jgi:ribose transport system substrate-binding protein
MKHHFKWTALLLVILSAGLVACEEPYHQKDEQYYFISANINIPYWQEAQAGLTDAAKTMGGKAEMDGPTTLSPKDELDSFNKAVALHPSGILVSVSNADMFRDPINAAVAAGIPVIAIDADSPDSKRIMFIGTDNFKAGQESAKRMSDILRARAKS